VEPIVIPDAAREPAAYVEALLATLGERDPIEVYAGTAQVVRDLCGGLDDGAWRVPLGPGEWDAYRVVGHLFDVDVVYGFRWRLALTEEHPTYPGYDERAWSTLARPEPAVLVTSLAALREANVALLRSLTPADLRRIAVHEEQGEEDVERMMSKVAGHDLAHLNQLQRTILAARAAA
jgi:hypothetical protein